MRLTEKELAQKLKENTELTIGTRGNPLLRFAAAIEHKYRAKPQYYNGVRYASKKEAQHAQDNDTKIEAGLMDFYLTQVPFRLPGGTIYRLDFMEFERVANTPLYEVKFVEVKGYKTPLGEVKRKQAAELYGIEIEVR